MSLLSLLRRECWSIRPRLLDGIEGRLSIRERGDVTEHLAHCRPCADHLADLAAARHAARRALAPYRHAVARVAPGRARVRARSGWSERRLVDVLLRLASGPAQHGMAFAVVAMLFFGALNAGSAETEQDVWSMAIFSASQRPTYDPDDPAWLGRMRYAPTQRVPVSDSLIIETTPTEPNSATSRDQPTGHDQRH
jgi:hypothetical protein